MDVGHGTGRRPSWGTHLRTIVRRGLVGLQVGGLTPLKYPVSAPLVHGKASGNFLLPTHQTEAPKFEKDSAPDDVKIRSVPRGGQVKPSLVIG